MNKNIKILLLSIVIICFILIATFLAFNNNNNNNNNDSDINNEEKITIVTTLFPTYDFARSIAGNLADVNLVIKPGTESHSYEPSILDIASITSSDLFIYTGTQLEPWTASLLSATEDSSNFVDASLGIILLENNDKDEDLAYDPHIWMSLKNAEIMAENIYNALCDLDSENIITYTQNYELLLDGLNNLDEQYSKLYSDYTLKTLAFACPFSFIYLTEEYNLRYISAYEFCSEHSEPSIYDVKKVIDFIKDNDIKIVLYDKLSTTKTAETISSETGAKMLNFNSIHNISKEDLESGYTYIDFMTENLNTIKEALNY